MIINMSQCHGLTIDGKRCQRETKNKMHCWQHQRLEKSHLIGGSDGSEMKQKTEEQLNHDLLNAIYDKQLDQVRKFLKAGANPNLVNLGVNALTIAIIVSKNLDIIRELLNAGADVNAKKGQALYVAVNADEPEIVRELLKSGANVNQKYTIGTRSSEVFEQTPLENAVNKQNLEMVHLLLKAGANEIPIAPPPSEQPPEKLTEIEPPEYTPPPQTGGKRKIIRYKKLKLKRSEI